MVFNNPVIPGFHPDPSVCRVGDDFYLVTSSFEYFPGVPIFHGTNLVNWTQVGHCLTRNSQLPLAGVKISGGIYAPTIRYHEGRFYVVTTNVTNGGNFYVFTDNPAGDWSEPIWVEQGGIDPDLFWDDDGTVYLSTSGILQSTIDIETGELTSEPVRTWQGCGGQYPEAPHLYKVNEVYYLMIAEGGTEYGHCVTIARSDSPFGPWESCPHNPILSHRSTNSPIQATGHADMIEDQNGDWWMVALGIRPQGHHPYHNLGRETFLTPVVWEDGWPIVGNNGKIAPQMEGHGSLPAAEKQSSSTRDDFDGDALPVYWNFIGNPRESTWSLSDTPRSLTLRCVASGMDTMEGLAWVGRRQQHWDFWAAAQLDFLPADESEEAGVTIFQNHKHHYDVAVSLRRGVRQLIVRRTIGTLTAEVASVAAPDGPVMLVLEGDESHYRLGFSLDGSFTALATGEAVYLSSEVGGAFTGVYLAMYATANGRQSSNAARFDWFEYRAQE